MAADKAKAERLKNKEAKGKKKAGKIFARPVELGGHTLEPVRCGGECIEWKCTTCRVRSAMWEKMAPKKCEGSKVEEWAKRAVKAADEEQVIGAGHRRAVSGEVVWCQVCGCYADSRARGLTDYCKGKPCDKSGGGRAGQLLYLRNNIHPRTRKALPPPIDEHGLDLGGKHHYRELELRRKKRTDCDTAQVESLGQQMAEVGGGNGTRTVGSQYVGKTAADKHRERLERIRAKEVASKTISVSRRLRGKQRPGAMRQGQAGECMTWHGMW